MRDSNASWWHRSVRSAPQGRASRFRRTAEPSRTKSRRRRRELAHESLEARLCLSASVDATAGLLTSQISWGGQTVTSRADSWIVRADSAQAHALNAALGDAANGAWASSSLGEGFYSLTAPGATTQDVLGWASTTAGVLYVEPDFVINPTATPDDPSFSRLWGLHNTGQTGGINDADIDAVEAWNTTTGSRDVVIAVIDTGIDYTHADLAANAWHNPGEIPGNGIDDDRNGFVDDVYGYDFVNNDSDPMDDNGHGTHVSGTIGAVGNDGAGVVGVNWQVSIMGLKFLSGSGSGSTSDAVRAVNYATMMRRDHGINIVATNNSWGGGGFSQSLSDAIDAGGNAGILFIAAAGNEGNNNDALPGYPASMTSEAIISVAATDSSNNLASFSNYGATSVDVGAPGVGIYSTLPGNQYASYSGTSMATPHVSGIVGLLAAANPNLTAAEIRTAILDTAVPIASLNGRVATGGLVNAAAALDAIAVGPSLRADIVNVSPDPRLDGVDQITIEFTSAVEGFGINDLTLTRDGTAISLLDDAALVTDDFQTWTIGNLAPLTSAVGTYELVLTAAGSGIVNGEGLTLSSDAADSWTVIEPPPPAPFEPNDSIATAAPVTLRGGRAAFSGVVGDGTYATADVDLFAVALAAGATITADVDARSLSPASTLDSYLRLFDATGRQLTYNDDSSGAAYLDSRLTYTVSAAGAYYVGVSSYGNSGYNPAVAGTGRSGATTGNYELVIDVVTPTPTLGADILDVSPDPRLDAVDAITIAFTSAVTGFDLGDLTLTRDGSQVSLSAAGVTLTSNDNIRWTLSDLSSLTGDVGSYSLVLTASGSGIISGEGASLTADVTDTWTVEPPPPPPALVADIIDVTPDPRLDAIATIAVTFNRAVTGVDLSDFALTRDGVEIPLLDAGDVGAAVALTTEDSITWTLHDLDPLTADPGLYELTLVADGSFIVDADALPLSGNAADSWRVLEPPPPAAFEPNDSIGTATTLTLIDGQTRVAAFVGDGVFGRADVDLYAVELTAAGTFTIDVDAQSLSTPSPLDSYLRLFDASGRQLAQNDDAAGSLDSAIAYSATTAGRYYVGVTSYGNTRYNPQVEGSGRNGRTSGDYELFVRFEAAPTDPGPDPDPDPPAPGLMEPNDSIATATAVVFENRQAVIAGVVGDGAYGRSDVDLLAVELVAGTTIEIDVDARTLATFSALDSYLRLFDADGRELASNDDSFGLADSYLRYTVDTSGTFYVGVSSYGNGNYNPEVAGSGRRGRTVGDYTVTLRHNGPLDPSTDPGTDPGTEPPPVQGPIEPNDSTATAVLLTTTSGRANASGTIGDGTYGAADVDLYAISLVAGSDVRIDIDARNLDTPSMLDSYLRLFDESGRELARNDDSGGSPDSLLTFTIEATGTYYIGVSSYGNSRYNPTLAGSGRSGRTAGDYLLTVDVNEPVQPAAVSILGFPDEAAPTQVTERLRAAAFADLSNTGSNSRWTLNRIR